MRQMFTILCALAMFLVVFIMSASAEEKVGEYTIYSAPGTDTTELKKWIDLLELVNQNIPVSFPMKGGD
jgi:hypothetical protein